MKYDDVELRKTNGEIIFTKSAVLTSDLTLKKFSTKGKI